MDKPVPNYWSGHCFGCSTTNPQGLRLDFWRSDDGCSTRCTLPDHLCGFDGLAHGGIICALLDEVAAWSLITRLARMGVTTEMQVRYLKPVPTRAELHLEGRIVRHHAREAVIHSTLRSQDGTLLAEAQTTWRFLSPARMAEITGADEAVLRAFLAHYASPA